MSSKKLSILTGWWIVLRGWPWYTGTSLICILPSMMSVCFSGVLPIQHHCHDKEHPDDQRDMCKTNTVKYMDSISHIMLPFLAASTHPFFSLTKLSSLILFSTCFLNLSSSLQLWENYKIKDIAFFDWKNNTWE